MTGPVGAATIDGVAQRALTVRRWQRTEYERLVDLGAFEREPVELIAGQLIVAEPQSSYHATTVGFIDDALRAFLPRGFFVRAQMPLALDADSAPEPDLAVVRGTREDYLTTHPARPVLVIEVADYSLHFDRHDKASLYARGHIADYWIVNLVERVLEVYRDPERDPSAPYGWRYRSVASLTPPAVVTPLEIPAIAIAVGDLLR